MIVLLYGLACLAVYAVNAWSASQDKPNYVDAQGVAGLLAISYGLTNVVHSAYGLTDAILAFPIIDFALTWMVLRAWLRNRRAWKLVLAGLLVAQLAAHAAFIVAWHNGEATMGGLWYYTLTINGTFALQLLTVGSTGASYVLGRLVRSLSNRRGSDPILHGR